MTFAAACRHPWLVAVLAGLLSVTASAARAETVLLRAHRMLDVRSDQLIAKASALIEDGKIKALGRDGRAPAAPAGVREINLGDMTLLPGLIDMHVHLDADSTYGGYTGLQFNDRFWSVLTVPHARKTLLAGFTTVRNVGSDAWNGVGLRQAIEAGQPQLRLEELQAIADEAHFWGLRVAAHAHGALGIKNAIRAGIDTIEHASLIDDEGIALA